MTITDSTPTATLQVSATALGDLSILALDGELTALTAAGLDPHTVRGTGGIILDLQRLYFLDQAGLAALQEFATANARAGRCLALAAVRPRIRAFLEYTDAQALAPTYTTVEEAADHLALARAAGA